MSTSRGINVSFSKNLEKQLYQRSVNLKLVARLSEVDMFASPIKQVLRVIEKLASYIKYK